MNYSIRTLENSSIAEITTSFNLSFADYVIPFLLTKEQLEAKMRRDSVELSLSAGVYLGDELVGFILHGLGIVGGVKVAYNAGTGIIPRARGNKLTEKLYSFIIPKLQSAKIDTVQLEVISTNNPAISVYQRIGFKKMRDLYSFNGTIANHLPVRNEIEIRAIDTYDWNILQSFWEVSPSWQNGILAMENISEDIVAFGAYRNERFVGYLILNPKNNQIQQLAVNKMYRRQGIGSELVRYITSIYGDDLSLINVDSNAIDTLHFIENLNLKNTINQYEMILKL